MSKKFNLVRDTDNDSPFWSIRRHLLIAALLVIVPIVVLVVLSIFSVSAEANRQVARDQELRDARATQVAMPTRTPLPTSTPRPTPVTHRVTTIAIVELRSGPGHEFPAVGMLIAGEAVTLIARNGTGQWYKIDDGYWLPASGIAGAYPDLPLAMRN